MNVLSVVGAVLELVGLLLTASALAAVWIANRNPEESLRSRVWADLRWTFETLTRRPHSVTVHEANFTVTVDAGAVGIVEVDNSSRPLDARVADLESRTSTLEQASVEASTRVDRLEKDLARVERVEQRLGDVESRQQKFEREAAVSDVPLASIGLSLAVVGLIMQVPAMVA